MADESAPEIPASGRYTPSLRKRIVEWIFRTRRVGEARRKYGLSMRELIEWITGYRKNEMRTTKRPRKT